MPNEKLRDDFARNPSAFFLVGDGVPISTVIGNVALPTDGYDPAARPLDIPEQGVTFSL